MTPDIREKAERLQREMLHNTTGLTERDLISQALLEAHNAGRAEMKEEAATNLLAQAEHYRKEGAWGDFAPICEHAATAIRSIT